MADCMSFPQFRLSVGFFAMMEGCA